MKKTAVKGWALVDKKGHLWAWGNDQFHVYSTRRGSREDNKSIGERKPVPCTITY